MKYLLIHHTGQLGGGTLSFVDVIKVLLKEKDEISVVLPTGGNAAKELVENLGIKVDKYDVNPITFGYYNGGSPVYKLFIKYLLLIKYRGSWIEIIKQKKPDVVVLNSLVQWPMIPIFKSLNIKTYCFVRETMKGSKNSVVNKIIANNLEKLDGIAFLSEYDKSQWNLSASLKQEIIPDLVDIKSFSNNLLKQDAREKLGLNRKSFYVLYVGGVSKLKGIDTILKAVNSCHNKDIKLLILGDTGEGIISKKGFSSIKDIGRRKFIKEVHSYIKDNDLNSQIEFVGIQKEMNYWYAASDVVVFPVQKAHQGRPIYEAGVFSKPVIVSNFPNFKEYLVPGKNGAVFEPGNYDELSNKIIQLYKDKNLADYLGNQNYNMTLQQHNSEIINGNIESFLKID